MYLNIRFVRSAQLASCVLSMMLACGFAIAQESGRKDSPKPLEGSVETASPKEAQTKKGKKGAESTAEQTLTSGEEQKMAQGRPANGSLFTDEAQGTNLVVDFKPRRVGDLVFVDVVEQSEATVTSGAKRNRDSGTLGGLIAATGAVPVPGVAAVAGVMGGLGARKYEGKGSTQRQSDLRARIAARVIEVLPNGDLRIAAMKSVKINKETEKLGLSGIIRQRDVAADNSIPTTAVGELNVELNGKGVASADNAPGWLFRLFEKIAPF
jgi:flagellar L-ring protein FlgH